MSKFIMPDKNKNHNLLVRCEYGKNATLNCHKVIINILDSARIKGFKRDFLGIKIRAILRSFINSIALVALVTSTSYLEVNLPSSL